MSPSTAASFAEGMAALNAGEFGTAERIFHAIVEREPAAHQAWLALAVVAIQAGSPDLAVERARRAVALDSKNVDYLNKLGVAYGEQGELRAAEQAFRRALKVNPAYAGAHHNLAKALRKQGRLAEALKEFERAYRLAPSTTEFQLSLARTYRSHGEPERALALLRTAVGGAVPTSAVVPDLAHCIADVEGIEAALSALRGILAQQPDCQPAHYTFAVMLLSVGAWREGWKHHLWRPHKARDRAKQPEMLPARLDGKRILLRGEYGLGDILFFLRFVPELRERGAAVALELPPQLAKLAPLLAERIEIAQPAAADWTVWIADLPSLLQTEQTPPAFPLRTDTNARARLAALGPPPYLGVTWRAGTDRRLGPEFGVDQRVLFKEIAPALLGATLRGWPGTLVSLQRAPLADELEAIRGAAGAAVHDLSAANENLPEVLAVLAALDEYVAVSNTNIHLLAGIKRTARVLVPYPPEWRWMRTPGESPWFPGFSVYRQPVSRDWSMPLERLRADLFTSAEAPPPARA
jgi:Flp pilus assembly protein TadD